MTGTGTGTVTATVTGVGFLGGLGRRCTALSKAAPRCARHWAFAGSGRADGWGRARCLMRGDAFPFRAGGLLRNPHERETLMSLHVQKVALEGIAALRPLVPLIRRSDRSLADQLTRAASSVVLNIAEGACSDPGNRRARYFSAAGSANEARAALRVAVTWGYVSSARAAPAEQVLDRVVAMLWRLTHARMSA